MYFSLIYLEYLVIDTYFSVEILTYAALTLTLQLLSLTLVELGINRANTSIFFKNALNNLIAIFYLFFR